MVVWTEPNPPTALRNCYVAFTLQLPRRDMTGTCPAARPTPAQPEAEPSGADATDSSAAHTAASPFDAGVPYDETVRRHAISRDQFRSLEVRSQDMKKLPTLAVVLLMTASLTSAAAAATIVVVSQDGQHQWHSRVTDGAGNPDPTAGSVTFVTGPAVPPRGIGSLRLMTNLLRGDGSAQMRSTAYAGVRLSSLTELTYWAYSAVNNGQQFPYLTLAVSCVTCAGGTDLLFFEPPYQEPFTGNPRCPDQGPTAPVTWQKWDALHGCWWDNNGELGSGGLLGVQPLSDFISNHPDAAIRNPNGLGGLRLLVGFASDIDNFDGNIDMVTVGVLGRSTSYDFEPPSACKNGDGEGDFEDKDGHKHHGQFHGNSCDNQGDEKDDDDQGRHFESNSVSSSTFTSDDNSQTMTMVGTGLDGGLPVAFTLVVIDYNGLAPAVYNLTLTNGRTFVGDLVSGTVSLD